MLTMLTALALLPGSPLLPPQTFFVQVAPAPRTADEIARSAGQDRAVVLLHGLWVHPFNQHNVGKAFLHAWQKPGSLMVKRLAQNADVYSFGYAQDVAVEDIAAGPGLDQCVKRLRELGYQSIVLVGHSAGGLIARQYVEDNPDSGVTKVIQLCAQRRLVVGRLACRGAGAGGVSVFADEGGTPGDAARPRRAADSAQRAVCLRRRQRAGRGRRPGAVPLPVDRGPAGAGHPSLFGRHHALADAAQQVRGGAGGRAGA